MDLTIKQELHRVFDLAAMRREAATLKTPDQWTEVTKIKRRCDDARTKEKDLYASRFETRVEVARRRLVDEAARQRREFKPRWAGEDCFDAASLLRQAQREVRSQHHRRVAVIDDQEIVKLNAVIERSQRLNEMRGRASKAFEQASDRRQHMRRSEDRTTRSGVGAQVIKLDNFRGPTRRR